MFQLVYTSTARFNLTEEDISNILVASRKWNYENGVTGSLIYNKGEFLQLLEGEETTVRELFEIIKKDVRHENIILIMESCKDERTFPSWNMAYYKAESDKEDQKIFKDTIIEFSDLVKKPTRAVDLFWTLARHIAS